MNFVIFGEELIWKRILSYRLRLQFLSYEIPFGEEFRKFWYCLVPSPRQQNTFLISLKSLELYHIHLKRDQDGQPPNFCCCYYYTPRVHRQTSKGRYLEKCEKKNKNHCTHLSRLFTRDLMIMVDKPFNLMHLCAPLDKQIFMTKNSQIFFLSNNPLPTRATGDSFVLRLHYKYV